MLCFSETWFKPSSTTESLDIDNFTLLRGDRKSETTNKERAGGVCVYINERWCHPNNAHNYNHHCDNNIELLTVTLRPYYLPRELPKVTVIVVYIQPNANTRISSDVLYENVNKQLSKTPDGAVFVTGDFNKCVPDCLHNFTQYIDVNTREDKTIDLCYGNIPGAYKAKALPPLGKSDHNMVLLEPIYKPKLITNKATTKTVRYLENDDASKLQACFDCTIWSCFINSCDSLDELVDTVSGYISFCEDMFTTTKTFKCYSNNKPWVNSELKKLLEVKRQAFVNKDKDKLKIIQKSIDSKIKENKNTYKSKINDQFKNNKSKDMWNNVKQIVGYTQKKSSFDISLDYANQLNKFYCRFDNHDFSSELNCLNGSLSDKHINFECPSISYDDVYRVFGSLKGNKACGPDRIKSTTLKMCRESLSYVYTYIFNRSLQDHYVPVSWKTSEIKPLPKKKNVCEMNDLRPIALTSIVMKSFEKLVKCLLKPSICQFEDPLQFAYQEGRSVEDAILTFTNNIYKHLERPRAYSRILFVDFSSAFNTIQPHLLISKLLDMNCNPYLISWILEFLTKRPQYVRLKNNNVDISSSIMLTSTGAPQGCVLSPLLFTIYTSACRSAYTEIPIIKFADDTIIQGLISCQTDLMNYFTTIHHFVTWCDAHFLSLNLLKTKEMIIDFRTKNNSHENVIIKCKEISTTDIYKYLGVTIDKNLNWHEQGSCVINKINQRLYFIRKLNSFNINRNIISLFYSSTMESIICFCLIAWGGNLTYKEENKINSIIKKVQKITHIPQLPLKNLFIKLVTKKINQIKANSQHPLYCEIRYSTRQISNIVLYPKIRTERYRNSFIPSGLRALNNQL